MASVFQIWAARMVLAFANILGNTVDEKMSKTIIQLRSQRDSERVQVSPEFPFRKTVLSEFLNSLVFLFDKQMLPRKMIKGSSQSETYGGRDLFFR